MMKLHTLSLPSLLAASCAAVAPALPAAEPAETVILPQFESVGMFKNGVAVVRAAFKAEAPGVFRWEKIPQVVHGTFWVESDATVTVHLTSRVVEVQDDREQPSGGLQNDLAGKVVTLTLKNQVNAEPKTLTGRVWELPSPIVTREWNTNYSSLTGGSGYWGYAGYFQRDNSGVQPTVPSLSTGGYLVLEKEGGDREYVELSTIASVSVKGPFAGAKRRLERPVLLFKLDKPGAVRISYLTKGIAWVPAYQLDLGDPAKLRLRQSAVIRNELMNLDGAELQLITGYPNIRFAQVDSPLMPAATLAGFFNQVNQSAYTANSMLSNSISQQAVYMNASRATEVPALPEGGEKGASSDDLHYESIGARTLQLGDSLALEIARGEAKYERVVEWTVDDLRDNSGRYQNHNRQEIDPNQAWDAVQFANPLKFPMTTAAATIVEGGKFRGQSQSQWVNPGQTTCLKITKALSVRTEASEVEEEGGREAVWIGGNDYRRTKVKGTLKVQNSRSSPITMVITTEFSGELIEADGNPEKSLRTEGVSSINPRRKLETTVKLAAGEEKTLTYRYSVLVDQ